MSDAPTPQTDAERIRLKRLAKLAGPSSNAASTPSTASPSNTVPASPASAPAPANNASPSASSNLTTAPKAHPLSRTSAAHSQGSQSTPPSPATSRLAAGNNLGKAAARMVQSANPSPRTKQPAAPFVFEKWEEDAIQVVFGVALDREVAQKGRLVWLKALQEEMIAEAPDAPVRANIEIADRLLIGRLELDPQGMSDDQDQIAVLTSLPPNQTTFEYLIGCWKRLNTQRQLILKRGLASNDLERVNPVLEKLRDLVISYAGLTLQEPSMFPQPQTDKPLGAEELLPSLYALATTTSVFSTSGDASTLLDPGSEIEPFLLDLVKRFDKDGLEDVLGGVVRLIAFSPGLAGGMVHTTATLPMSLTPTSWRESVAALQCLFSIKQIAAMITGLPEWNPPLFDETTNLGAKNGKQHEQMSILGMIMRLGIFARDWPAVLAGYYNDFDKMSARDREASDASLKSSLTFLRSSLFNIVNSVVRAGPEPREAFLAFVARVVQLNQKRAAMRFKYEKQASDSFMHNLNYVLLRLAEPFMDAQYKQLNEDISMTWKSLMGQTYLEHVGIAGPLRVPCGGRREDT